MLCSFACCRASGRVIAALVVASICALGVGAAHAAFVQTNLVSDVLGLGAHFDPNLRNPWGIASTGTSPFWLADNATGLATIYTSDGTPQALVVTIPPTPGSPANTIGSPTGTVFNSTGASFTSFDDVDLFLFATEGGTIAGWRGALGTAGETLFDDSASGASYTGIAVSGSGAGALLYAADFANGRIATYNAAGGSIVGGFTDPVLPAGYSPFNIQNLGGTLFVTYAMIDPNTGDEVPGPSFGFVDEYDLTGNLILRLVSGGALNAPWGLALAPAGFGPFGGALIVGNFGDGRINAFNPTTGAFLGTLSDSVGDPLEIEGLWGLRFGNGGNGGLPDTLYFAAGINGEADGLFGSIGPTASVPEPGTTYLLLACVLTAAWMSRAKRAH
jgi:uncharacterized protein (TIGR03118 family)